MRVLILMLLAVNVARAADDKLLTKTSVDLNGDGKKESVSIEIGKEHARAGADYTLHVGGLAVKGRLWEGVDGFYVVDIDSSDRYKELAVHTSGPSDDFAVHLYRYDGKRINDMGMVDGVTVFPGNNTVLASTWMGFWSKHDKYVVTKPSRTIKLVPQDLYWVNVKATVGKSFTICTSRSNPSPLAILRAGSEILVVACDPTPTTCPGIKDKGYADYGCDWYLIRSERQLLGWARCDSLMSNTEGLPLAD